MTYFKITHIVPAAARFAHRRQEANILDMFEVEVLPSVVEALPLEQQLQQRNGLLRTVFVHL